MFACDAVRRVLHTLPEGNAVWGVTSLDNLLYVLRQKRSKQIEVYDKDSYCLQYCLTVTTLDTMADIASCGHNRCLYIAGYTDKCIHKVALPDAAAVKWQLNGYISGLSVTDSHTLLATCFWVRRIKEFTTDGELLRQFQLPKDIMSPQHAVQLSSGQYAVCHGGRRETLGLQRVCLIDSDGHVIKSYGGSWGSGTHQLGMPTHLAVDGNESVFVADFNNSRVLSLSPSLTYTGEVLSSEQLKWQPRRLFIDADRGRLYVAENEVKEGSKFAGGRVVVVNYS